MVTLETLSTSMADAPTAPANGHFANLHEGNGMQDQAEESANVGGQDVEEEHPDAPHVRRQVEYYFSDENLPTDLHLLQCCGGRDNLPVSISRIRGFKKMRQFKDKKMVLAALRKSTFLDVTEDGKGVKRKVPLTGKCLIDPDYHAPDQDDDEIAYDPRSKRAVQHPVPLLPQTKKELPPGMTKSMMKPTGFEDSYVEGPLAPAEAEEEEEMYSPDKHFIERIEIAIQRFKQRRRMHEMYSKIFGKWMKYGGVDNEPRMFGGISKQEMKAMTTEEIARATATYSVPWNRADTKKWTVDFVGVAEGFLSSFYPYCYGYAPDQVKTACQVLRSFFQYLLFHSVCPEYTDQLLLARKLCDQAEKELPQVDQAGNALPGEFNKASSTIFEGHHANTYICNSAWFEDMSEEEKKAAEAVGMRNEEAMITFKTAVAIYGTDEQFALLDAADAKLSGFKITKSEEVTLEVVDIQSSTAETQEYYKQQNVEWKHKLSLQPLGRLICKAIIVGDASEWDLPVDCTASEAASQNGNQHKFWVEDEILAKCFKGMKMWAVVLTVTGGFVILDQVKTVMCSFYKWIPNELWMSNKPPKELRIIKKGILELEEERGMQPIGVNGDDEAAEMSDDFDDE